MKTKQVVPPPPGARAGQVWVQRTLDELLAEAPAMARRMEAQRCAEGGPGWLPRTWEELTKLEERTPPGQERRAAPPAGCGTAAPGCALPRAGEGACATRARAPVAPARAKPNSVSSRILAFLRAHGDHGATRRELARLLRIERAQVRARAWELLGRNTRCPRAPKLVERGFRVSRHGRRNRVLVAVNLERDEELGRRIAEYARARGEAGATRAEIASALHQKPSRVALQVRYLLGECAWDRGSPRLRRNGARPGPHGIEHQVFVTTAV